jgi:shikimate dehydrogenase
VTQAITSNTRVFAILGDPVGHSRSPLLHNAAMRARDIDAVYVALRCTEDDFAGTLRSLAGGNVTIPHKGNAAAVVDKPSARVRATLACNTFWSSNGNTYGENTDVAGFTNSVKQVMADLRGARALVIGAGGGARAVLYGLLEEGCEGVTVLGRSRERAREIAIVAGRRGGRVEYSISDRGLRNEGFDLVINATPLGLRARDRFPLRFNKIAAVRAVFDIAYRAEGETEWVTYARSLGIPAADGREMLVQQAAAAFELWFDQVAPIDAMRRAFGS